MLGGRQRRLQWTASLQAFSRQGSKNLASTVRLDSHPSCSKTKCQQKAAARSLLQQNHEHHQHWHQQQKQRPIDAAVSEPQPVQSHLTADVMGLILRPRNIPGKLAMGVPDDYDPSKPRALDSSRVPDKSGWHRTGHVDSRGSLESCKLFAKSTGNHHPSANRPGHDESCRSPQSCV